MSEWTDDELRNILNTVVPSTAWEYQLAEILLRERATYTARLVLAERARDAAIGRVAAVEAERDAAIERATCLDAAHRAIAGVESLRQERDALAMQNRALREALEHCRHRPHEHNPLPTWQGPTQCGVIDRALALDLPRAGAIAEAARRVCEAVGNFFDAPHDIDTEIDRLEAIRQALAEWRKAKEG